ncbi:MAG: hypothetical protein HY545_00655 [Candidatus Doudnabacteria bacterium]|nr:hypothetical protein [Candidatus Doudnabacteria bacterium]
MEHKLVFLLLLKHHKWKEVSAVVENPYNLLIREFNVKSPEARLDEEWRDSWAARARALMEKSDELSEAQLMQLANRLEELGVPANS